MTAASLQPEAALAYLRELSPGVRAAVLLDADAGVLAGDPSLARTAGGEADGDRGLMTFSHAGLTLVVLAPSGPAGPAASALQALARVDAQAALAAAVGEVDGGPR